MKIKIIFPILSALMLCMCGCAYLYDPQKIEFPSEALVPPMPADPAPIGGSKLAKAEIAQIESAVLENLLQRHLGDDGSYSAVFLHASQATTDALMKKFPNHVPPIKNVWHLEMRDAQSPLDQDTLRPALVLSVETLEPENDIVQTIGRWDGGAAVKGFHTFDLQKNNGVWFVANVK